MRVSATESSLLLWVLGAMVILMAASVCMGWIRQAQLNPSFRENWLACVIASAALGTGLSGAIVLALGAEALPFPVGYRYRDVPLLWAGAILGCLPAVAWLGLSQRWFAVVISGMWLGVLAFALQMGWINAIGFRPGLQWRDAFLVAAAVLMVMGFTLSFWLGFSDASRVGQRRMLWRVGSSVLLGLTVVAGQEVLLSGSTMLGQVGSVYRLQAPSPVLCLVFGVVVPLVFLIALFDLRMLRSHQRRTRRREARVARPDAGSTLSGAPVSTSAAPLNPPNTASAPR